MAQYTEPDGTIVVVIDDKNEVAFKPGTPQAEIDAKVKQMTVSTAKDVGLSAVSAVPKAVTGLAGMLPDFANMAKAGREKLVSYLPESAQAVSRAIPNPYEMAFGALPGSQELRGVVEQATGPLYEPQTMAGRATDVVTQGAVGMGRGLVQDPRLAMKLLGLQAAGAEAGGQLSEQNPWARAAGGMLASGPAMFANRSKSLLGKEVRDSVGELTPQQIAAAQAMQAEGRRQGVPLMGTEALDRGHELASYVGASPTGNPIIQNFIRNRPKQVATAVEREIIAPTGARGTPQVNARRAQTSAEAALNTAEETRRRLTAPQYQAASQGVIPEQEVADLYSRMMARSGADESRLLQGPLEDYASRLIKPNQPPPPPPLPAAGAPPIFRTIDEAIIGNPQPPILKTIEEAASTLNPHGYGTTFQDPFVPIATRTPQFVTGVDSLDRLRKAMRDRAKLPIGSVNALDNEQKGAVAGFSKDLKGVLRKNSPEWERARANFQAVSEAEVNPLMRSPVGRIAGRVGVDPTEASPVTRIIESVSDPKLVRPEDIRMTYRAMNAEDPQAFRGVVQTYVENKLDDALKKVRTGPSPTTGAKFSNAVAGTPIERANFEEMMRGVALSNGANPGTFTKGVNNLLDVLERTGRTPGMGSQTESRQQFSQASGKNLASDTADVISMAPLSSVSTRLRDWTRRNRNQELAKVLTSPDSVEKLVELAKYKPDTMTARWLVVQILGIQDAEQEQ